MILVVCDNVHPSVILVDSNSHHSGVELDHVVVILANMLFHTRRNLVGTRAATVNSASISHLGLCMKERTTYSMQNHCVGGALGPGCQPKATA